MKPKNNAFKDGGWGAWEVGVRVSNLDFSDDAVSSSYRGELDNWTLGLNWYLNPNMRIMWNYVDTELDRDYCSKNDASAFMTRFQIDF